MTTETKSTAIERKRNKRRGRDSFGSDDFLIEELFPDDMAYDADVEVVRPDRYEDAESDFDSDSVGKTKIRTIDEELAERMRQLGGARTLPISRTKFADRGRKRTSNEIDDDASILNTPMSPGFEVLEMANNNEQPSPAKRRKRRSKRLDSISHALRNHAESWTDSSEKADTNTESNQNGSSSRTTTLEIPAHADGEVMDIT